MLAEKTERREIVKKLEAVTELLDPQQDKDLIADIAILSDYASNPNLIVSVFGSFNRGKSTLLNALLDKKILPSGLVPTTGTTIKIKYGTELKTRIILNDGTAINEPGTEALKSFTRLNSERQMRSDIVSVEVFVPHSWLKNGIELVDLPGTNDREEQNELVYNQLLSADLIIQVLDASQLMTLEEASNLQYWTIDRGIKTVIFVVNFVNLLEEDDQKLVMQRARSLAKEFRGDFPKDIDNLYRVDALPALKARQKGELQAALDTGITNFESALRNIAYILSNDIDRYRLPRIKLISRQVKQSLEAQIQALEADLEVVSSQRNQQLQKLDELKTNFQSVSNKFKKWVSTDDELSKYKPILSKALKENNFSTWKTNFEQTLNNRIEILDKNLEKVSNLLQQDKPEKLSISLPNIPEISLPTKPEEQEERTKRSVGIATGIGWVVLGPVGGAIAAGATHYANEQHKKKQQELWSEYYSKLSNVYDNAAKKYLEQVQNIATAQLEQYQKGVDNMFNLSYTKELAEEVKETEKKDLLNELNNALTNLKSFKS